MFAKRPLIKAFFLLTFAVASVLPLYGQTGLLPQAEFQAINANGQPLSGGMVYTYVAGTTTPQATYTDSSASVQNPNPVILDSAGRASIWISNNAYKIIVTDANGVVQYSQDNVTNLSGGVTAPVQVSEGGTGMTTAGTGLQVLRTKANTTSPSLEYASLPVVSAPDYNFSPQAPGGSLTGGTPATVTLTPCPLGVNQNDSKHYLYLSGGTGTAEAVLITGGTCASSAASGTITFTPANSHSGSWTIGSATAGMTEAEEWLGTQGGTILIPGNITVQAATPLKDNMTFQGIGTPWISVTSSSGIIFDANVPTHATCPGSGCDGGGPQDNISVKNIVLDAHAFSGQNTAYGIRQLLSSPSSTEENGISTVDIENVACNNVFNCLYFQRSKAVHVINTKLYANSLITFTDASFNPQYNTYDAVVDKLEQHMGCINNDCGLLNVTATAIITFQNCISCKVVNSSIEGLPGGLTGADGIRIDGNMQDFNMSGNSLDQCRICVIMGTTSYSGTTFYPSYIQIENNAIDQPWAAGIELPPGTATTDFNSTQSVIIEGNTLSNPREEGGTSNSLINLGSYNKWITIRGNHINDILSTPAQVGITMEAGVDNVVIKNNHFETLAVHAGPSNTGIFVSTTATNIYYGDNVFVNIATPVTDSSAPSATGAISDGNGSLVLQPGQVTVNGLPKFSGTNLTSTGSASLGSNCPAANCTVPYTWIKAISADGSSVWIPAWK